MASVFLSRKSVKFSKVGLQRCKPAKPTVAQFSAPVLGPNLKYTLKHSNVEKGPFRCLNISQRYSDGGFLLIDPVFSSNLGPILFVFRNRTVRYTTETR